MEVIYATGDINKFLENLEKPIEIQALKLIDLLAIRGHELRLPHSRALGGGLFELRLMGSHAVRLLYCFHAGKAYILHAVMKKRNALTTSDIAKAQRIHRILIA
jgi:phage-related protein